MWPSSLPGLTLLDPAEVQTSVQFPFSSTWVASLFEDGDLVDQRPDSSTLNLRCKAVLLELRQLLDSREGQGVLQVPTVLRSAWGECLCTALRVAPRAPYARQFKA